MTEAKAPRKRPSGVKSESSGEAAQIRKLAALIAESSARMDRLERTVDALTQGNLHNAREAFDG